MVAPTAVRPKLGVTLSHIRCMNSPPSPPDGPPSRFRSTLVRVLIVQAVALTLLGLLQLVYNVS